MESVSHATPKTKPADAHGTDSDVIASRLQTFYGNQHASSPRDVKTIPSQKKNDPRPFINESHVVRCLDANNNVCLLSATKQD